MISNIRSGTTSTNKSLIIRHHSRCSCYWIYKCLGSWLVINLIVVDSL